MKSSRETEAKMHCLAFVTLDAGNVCAVAGQIFLFPRRPTTTPPPHQRHPLSFARRKSKRLTTKQLLFRSGRLLVGCSRSHSRNGSRNSCSGLRNLPHFHRTMRRRRAHRTGAAADIWIFPNLTLAPQTEKTGTCAAFTGTTRKFVSGSLRLCKERNQGRRLLRRLLLCLFNRITTAGSQRRTLFLRGEARGQQSSFLSSSPGSESSSILALFFVNAAGAARFFFKGGAQESSQSCLSLFSCDALALSQLPASSSSSSILATLSLRAAATSLKLTNDDYDDSVFGPRLCHQVLKERPKGWKGGDVTVVVFVDFVVVNLFSAKRADPGKPGGEPEEALAKTDDDILPLPPRPTPVDIFEGLEGAGGDRGVLQLCPEAAADPGAKTGTGLPLFSLSDA